MPPTPAPNSKKLCSYFVKKGSCAYGDRCTKLHASSSSPRTNPSSRHSRKPGPQIASPKPQYPAATSSVAGTVINRSPTPPDIESSIPSTSAPRARPVRQEKDLCNFYAIGLCEGGDECEFRHEGAAETSEVADRHPPSPQIIPSTARVCRHYKKGKCREGATCKFSHDKGNSPKVLSPIPNIASPQLQASPIRDDSPSPRPPSPIVQRPTSDSAWYQGAGSGSKADVPKGPGNPPESDDEDQFADADEDEEESSEIYTSIVKSPSAAYVQGRGLSPEPTTQRRVYPVVASPKAIPYVTDIVPHWSQFADPKADGGVPFCKQLAQNQCALGEECRFRHSLTIDEYAMLFKDLQPNMWTISRTEQPRPALSSPPTTTKVSPLPVARASTKVASKSSVKGPVAPKKPCDFWPKGKCFNGDKCPFAHIGSPLPRSDSSQPPKFPTICRNLQYDGECKYGSSCHYSHDLAPTSTDQEEQEQEDHGWGVTTNDDAWGEDSTTQKAEEPANNWWGAPADDNNGWGTPADNNDGGGAVTAGANSTRGARIDPNDGRGSSRDSQTHDNWSAGGSSSRTGTRPGSRVCFDFTKSRCSRSNCRYSHDLSGGGDSGQRSGRDSGLSGSGVSGSTVERRHRGRCRDYLQGRCTRGDQCRFSHDEEPAVQEATSADYSGWDNQPVGNSVDESWGQAETKEDWMDQGQAEDGGGWAAGTEGALGEPGDPENIQEAEEGPQDSDEPWGEHLEEDSQGWGDVPAEDSEAAKVQKPCKAFGQGTCMRGDSCWFLHELPEDQVQFHREQDEESVKPELEEQVEASYAYTEEASNPVDELVAEDPVLPEAPSPEPELKPEPDINLERFMYHCTVNFNNRCSPQSVMTAADSCNIVLSNLPPDSNTAEIHTLAASFGVVKELAFLGEAADSATVSIEFAKPEDAVAAVKQLNDQKFGSKPILAKLDSRTPVFARSPLHSQMLMVSWPGATLVGWSYYPSITIAKAVAAKLDKTMFKDRKIGAIFERPGKKGPYAIRLTNLPPGATKAELDAFCTDPTPNLTTLGEPSYSQSPEDYIRDELKKYGRVEGFRVCPQDDGTFRTIAYVTMQTYSAADEAARALDKTTPSYLGKATLEVKHIYLASYKVLPEIFECIRDRLGIIRDSHKDKCTILDDFDGYTHNVELRSSIGDSTSFAEANVELGKLIDGSLILDEDGGRLWDPYLNLPSSAKAVNKINDTNSDVPCFVHCDKRLQCVRVYGSADGQVRGKKTLLKILKKVSEQCHEIELDRAAQIATLVEGGLIRLQGSLGENKISLNIVDARLTVRGTAEDLETAKGIVSELAASPSSPPSGLAVGSNLCPLCERVPVSPVRLTCRHAYCQACLQFALASTAKRDFNTLSPFFTCIAPLRSGPKSQAGGPDAVVQRCNAPLSYVVVRDNLTTSQENLYLKAVFTASVRTSAGRFFFCPTPNCSVVHRAGEEGIVVQCPECSSDVCPKCSRRIHGGSLCEV